MTYVFERDEGPAEVRRSVAGTLRHWPKVDGTGNVAASATAGDNRVTVYDNAGVILASEANVAPTTVGAVSRFDLPIPAIATLQEHAYAVLAWKASGGTEEYVETIYFDVVLQPWGGAWCSSNDMLSRVPGMVPRLDAQRARLDSGGTLTADQLAAQYASLAHQELYRRIRRQCAVDAQESGGVRVRPRLIVDRLLLHPIEVAIAISYVYRADLTEGASFDGRFTQEARVLYEDWAKLAEAEFLRLGTLAYDTSEDRVADNELRGFGRTIKVRRVQA